MSQDLFEGLFQCLARERRGYATFAMREQWAIFVLQAHI